MEDELKAFGRMVVVSALMLILAACGQSQSTTGASVTSIEESSGDHHEASPPASSSTESPEITEGDQVQAHTVTFGKYKNQDIDWYILTEDDRKAFLLSVYVIDTKPFSKSTACWDQSSLRTWLNDDFYRETFRAEEQEKILLTNLDNGDDLNYGTKTGADTEDRIFLLSASEARQYRNS